jgi:hypothetical protein
MPIQTQQQETLLTADELQSVMKDAIARHGQAERVAETERVSGLSTVDEALAIARDLNIPEEHVLAAVNDRNKAKLLEQRRQSIRKSRQNALWLWLGGACGFTAMAAVVSGITHGFPWVVAFPTFAAWIGAVWFAYKAFFAPVTDSEAQDADVIPVGGTCRVCGAPAYNERATFCEEHRYKGPTST